MTKYLMEAICAPDNIAAAMRAVVRNKGAAGVDGMTIRDLPAAVAAHWPEIERDLLGGRYQPQPVRRVSIPKPDGGERHLGIPTVFDRLIQQAVLQRLQPVWDPTFSEHSYGFRPGRSAHQAVVQAQAYVIEGYRFVVDFDLAKFFDRVNHDILMARLARRIGDKRLLRIVRRFLQAGMMADGVRSERREGTPQGGPLSPLLANLLLDDLDKELERRGHRFCRYADDCNIYVRSQAAGERVMASVTSFLEGKLRLKVNQQKSAVAPAGERQFLGHRLGKGGRPGIGRKSLARAKDRLREITRRNRGHVPLGQMIEEVNSFVIGWVTYFRDAECQSTLRELDGWLRRKLRCVKLKRCKGFRTIVGFLMTNGVVRDSAWRLASSGKGWWRLSDTQQAKRAMSVRWFDALGLVNLANYHAALNIVGNRRGT
jgi:RNA-directed DNA polymerase